MVVEGGLTPTSAGGRDAPPLIPTEASEGPDFRGKTCFIIMPYGKPDQKSPSAAAAASDGKTEREHFDDVYQFIRKTVEALSIRPLRSDHNQEVVPIHANMLTEIIDADLAIIDITNHNANVFYELGVRHTARRNATLLIGFGQTLPPFNLTSVPVLSYDLSSPKGTEDSMRRLRDAIVANLSSRVTDSLVHSLLPGLNLSRPQQALKHDREARKVAFTVPQKTGTSRSGGASTPPPRTFELGVIKGDLIDVDLVDVWVNPESTRMEMARIHDDSVSAFIRYHGAKKDSQGNVVSDSVRDALRQQVGNSHVEAGWVIVTRPGDLKNVNVRAIFHVAAQHGEPCNGYHTIKTYTSVIANALEKMDELNNARLRRWRLLGTTRPLTSIIFPLLGTRSRDVDPIDVTVNLVREARKYLTLWPDTQIKSVYFLAYTKRDLELCEAAFQRLNMPL